MRLLSMRRRDTDRSLQTNARNRRHSRIGHSDFPMRFSNACALGTEDRNRSVIPRMQISPASDRSPWSSSSKVGVTHSGDAKAG